MKLGAFDIYPVSDGSFRLDGGAMFGVVPKAIWERCCPADDANRIPLSLTCLLIKAHGKNIMVDTGLGEKEDVKFRQRFAVERTPGLLQSLQRLGVDREDVHMVINTHLHFDHAGGNTMKSGTTLDVTFPKADYMVQQGEYDEAIQANERTKASYRPDNFMPVSQSNRLCLLQGDTELVPGVRAVVTAGHTRHHQGVLIESEGQSAFFLGDLIPTVSHLPLPYIMGYDLHPLQTLETKRWVLDRAYRDHWLLIFEHDPEVRMGRVGRDTEGKYFLEKVDA